MKGFSLGLVVSSCILAAGCAGTGNNSSPFFGNYTGTYHATNVADDGTLNVQVDQGGVVGGTITANATGTVAQVNGNIQDNGDISGDITFTGQDDPFGGNLQFNSNGDLAGQVNITTSGAPNGVERTNWALVLTAKRKGLKPGVVAPLRH